MSRGSKYSAEEKLKIVEACLSGAIGMREAGRRVGADGKTIWRWISRYKAEGPSAFMPADHNRTYPEELKRERYYGKRFTSREALANMIEEYITYYNTRRLQRGLGVLTPLEKHELYFTA